jgi:hypothetical protein
MNFLKEIWDFPAHHVALGWWLAAALTFWNVAAKVIGRIVAHFSILGRRFQEDQLSKRIRNLEYLRENTNGLIRYLASDVVDIAIESCWMCVTFVILLIRVMPASSGAIFGIVAINISSSVIGRAWRIRTMLNDLKNYPTSVELLKARVNLLQS